MIIQRCPRCGSDRIRRGYRRTPWWQAIFGRYNLLCNACNWEFVGLAIPGTVPEQHLNKRRRQSSGKGTTQPAKTSQDDNQFAETQELSETISLGFDNQNVEKSPSDLATFPISSLAISDLQSDIDKRVLKIHSNIEATDDNDSNPVENEKAMGNAPNNAASAITANNKTKRTKSRKRIKGKK